MPLLLLSRPPNEPQPRHQASEALRGAPELDRSTARLEDHAAYYSRRAREECYAAHHAPDRKSRNVHEELASAYEFRAHLLTQALAYDPASQL